ncbi:hypothetical protein [Paenibacillus apiarius]|uniref:Ribbon-helix-helix protein CopG domain-containing protein n=1 Tax=Paenibacillus apiarius TaxID=46240 RepID=A0ABT4DQ49_9BACL|nr:hypothetical protein [Paenibacillus apiarius]MBN3524170.1 hypothetical protein [Paenibacillus apiarius]MCY9513956.1 hypothetical protein [Paenibacillus apiarius]MCY9519473.1 hypothetical protein [Paenibacillus apiarius]MCY9552400.1 hypothetical protein [Paenibacillus apiarius]MCY9556228.1 hypothetical protein [Paenibacillus apiarius]
MPNNKIKLGVPSDEGQVSIMFTRGGPRKGAGRKGFGETKKISLTLTKELWGEIEQRCSSRNCSRSETIRDIIESYFNAESER